MTVTLSASMSLFDVVLLAMVVGFGLSAGQWAWHQIAGIPTLKFGWHDGRFYWAWKEKT